MADPARKPLTLEERVNGLTANVDQIDAAMRKLIMAVGWLMVAVIAFVLYLDRRIVNA